MNFGVEIWCIPSEKMSLKLLLPYGSMLTKRKKNRKTSKITNFEQQNGLEIWWVGTCPKKLTLIRSVVGEKTMPTDDDGRPRDDSSTVQ